MNQVGRPSGIPGGDLEACQFEFSMDENIAELVGQQLKFDMCQVNKNVEVLEAAINWLKSPLQADA